MEVEVHIPTVIFSHGIGGSGSDGSTYAGVLAKHEYTVYCLDFYGAGHGAYGENDERTIRLMIEYF